MALDKATVAHIATLARIKLAESEQDKIASELSHILSWVEQLREIDTSGVEPMTSVAAMRLLFLRHLDARERGDPRHGGLVQRHAVDVPAISAPT